MLEHKSRRSRAIEATIPVNRCGVRPFPKVLIPLTDNARDRVDVFRIDDVGTRASEDVGTCRVAFGEDQEPGGEADIFIDFAWN